jgi:hypothetical protein
VIIDDDYFIGPDLIDIEARKQEGWRLVGGFDRSLMSVPC